MIRERATSSPIVRNREGLTSALAAVFDRDRRVLCAFLFGSRATGSETPLSDIDLAYHSTSPLGLQEEADLLYQLGSAVGTFEIDLVGLTAMPLRSRLEVLESGRLVYTRAPEAVPDLLERTRHEYFDFLPFEREYHREFLSNLRQGGGRLR